MYRRGGGAGYFCTARHSPSWPPCQLTLQPPPHGIEGLLTFSGSMPKAIKTCFDASLISCVHRSTSGLPLTEGIARVARAIPLRPSASDVAIAL